MIRDEHLDAAVAQGIIDAGQAARLRALARGEAVPDARDPAADPDDEKFRLIGGFNDVFVTIGVLLLVAALFGLASQFGFGAGIAFVAMIVAWGLAEFFSRRMRLALPSIVLALMFAGAGAFVGVSLGSALFGDGGAAGVLAGLVAALAALLHGARFRVPIDSAIAASGGICAIVSLLYLLAPDFMQQHSAIPLAVLGLLVFALAVRVDASDVTRQTRRADVAFWLHMLSAPLIVHAAIPLVTGGRGELDTPQAILILAVFALLGLVALVIDRRALLIAGLSYAGIAIAYLLSQSVGEGLRLSVTLLGLAVLVLSLSAGWRSLRRALLPLLPLGGLARYVPPAHLSDAR
jgi:hypothetical protein